MLATGAAPADAARPGAPGSTVSPTAAGATGTTSPPVGLSLVSQTPWVALRATFSMTLHVDDPALAARPGAAISVRVDPSVTTRIAFDDAVQGNDLGNSLYEPPLISVASLHPDARGNVTLVYRLGRSDTEPTIGVSRPGVYPVEVQLVNTGEPTGRVVTWLVVVDTGTDHPIDKKLSVAFVLQAVADPIRLPDGEDDPRVVAQISRGGRLDKVATVLSRTAGARYSLVVSPETAIAWQRLGAKDANARASFARLRAAATASTTELLPTTYVPIDTAALDAAGMGAYLPKEEDAAAAAYRTAFGSNPSEQSQSAFIDQLATTDAAVDGLRQKLINRVALREPALIPMQHRFTPDQAFVLDTTGGSSRGVATAPFVERLLTDPGSSALRAQRVIAALAEIAYESPGIARGIVVAPGARWTPDASAMQTIFSALHTLPLVQSATLDELFATITTEQAFGTDVQRRLAPAIPPSMPVDAAEYARISGELAAYRGVVGADDSVVVAGETTLLTTLSTAISADRAHTELAGIDAAVQAFTAGVTADEKRITLTSRRAQVPLTFENDLKPARSVAVRVHLESAKLLFPGGPDQLVTLKPGSNTVRFAVEARASGTFPMTISVTSADGSLPFGAPVRVTVRSAVFGGWAVGLTIAALLFLAGWWANHFRRVRRARRRAASAAPAVAP